MGVAGADFDAFAVVAAPRLARLAATLSGSTVAAEDLAQDVLIQVYLRWGRIDDPWAYARRALVNRTVNRFRWLARRKEVPLTSAHDVPSTVDGTEYVDGMAALLTALAQLGPRQRAVVALRYLEDCSEQETAQILGCAVGTVKSQASRAVTRLRELLDDAAVGCGPE